MKRFSIILLFVGLLAGTSAKAQIYSPQLAGYYGFGTVMYNYGYYQGNLVNGVAHGNGTFYFRDGTIFEGSFSNGWRNGPGVLANPRNGYVSGCWSNGQYLGACGGNRYDNDRSVRRVVDDAYDDFNEDARFVATSPEGYEIEQGDPNTQMGQQLLGRYSGG